MKLYAAILLCLLATFSYASPQNTALISIIIDDMGNHPNLDKQVVNLPGPVTCSILPYSYNDISIADLAHSMDKEIIVHVPMEAIRGNYLGPGGLLKNMTQAQFNEILSEDLNRLPYIEGMNNHMGSLLTQCPLQMNWVMQMLKPTGLFYVDSRTVSHTVAEQIANLNDVPIIRRDVFLDHVATSAAVAAQFSRLISIARAQGWAVAIGHPYPVTLRYLQQKLPGLQQQGIELVPLSQLVADHKFVEEIIDPVK